MLGLYNLDTIKKTLMDQLKQFPHLLAAFSLSVWYLQHDSPAQRAAAAGEAGRGHGGALPGAGDLALSFNWMLELSTKVKEL